MARASTLAEAQFVIGRAHSVETWRDFADHVERLSRKDGGADPFESGADATAKDYCGMTGLAWAEANGHVELAGLLVAARTA
jgi:hypothetical protein